ncbi:MAG: strawberry notch C-terminal domain-containing protein, partial [Crocinitomicaceae bacterium]|nr:strawberry notch C-terminal domain-containing protein [Crocinitomicaceae bacterium]
MNNNKHISFAMEIEKLLLGGNKVSRLQTEKIARQFGITDKTQIKELVELAVVNHARTLANASGSEKKRFDSIVELYNRQPNLSHRNSTSVALNQYSTSIPIGFVMGQYCKLNDPKTMAFEPSAGNGALTILGHTRKVVVNELDSFRVKNLRSVFSFVFQYDASKRFPKQHYRSYDAVLMNPPFGFLENPVDYNGFKIKSLDHLMTLNALQTMKPEGRAAIIIGGHTRYDSKGRVQKGEGRFFLNYLYHHYYVEDIILIDSSKLYAKQGTSFKLRLILIHGRKENPKGAAPLKKYTNLEVISSFDDLYTRIQENLGNMEKVDITAMEKWADELLSQELGAPYEPASDACFVLDTQVPDSMAFEMHEAVNRIKEDVGGDIDNFVRHRLGYHTKVQLCKVLSAEQIDAVAMAIYNVEALNQAVIIGDQTGIGKGRVAASMIRYAVEQGIKPIFLTEKANLFSDIYRDLKAIGSAGLVPFIINSKESKTDIKDESGNVIYSAPDRPEQDGIINDHVLPSSYDYIIATYSQFNSPKKPAKRNYILSQAKGSLVIMDESHNASGLSNTGQFMRMVLDKSTGAVFLSATFAKRPDNMPIYAMKTAISEASMSHEDLVEAITKGGVALQEVLASLLVAEGQMIRRERTYEGVRVDYTTLSSKAQEHKAIADNITKIIRDIIAFQANHINARVGAIDEILAAEGEEANITQGTQNAGADNIPYFSKVFNIINQMLFSIKADAVADLAIEKLKQGKKPLIAFSSTMGSFIEQMENEHGGSVGIGDTVKADFSIVLEKGLQGVMRYTETRFTGKKDFKIFQVSDLSPEAQTEYARISGEIKQIATGITISPIDVVVQKLTEAGYKVAEVTGRKLKLQLNLDSGMGIVQSRKRINTNDAFRQFNDNEVDVLLINQSGSTGASAHAIVTDKVSKSEVKQRVMIVLQPELDINQEVQKRGRIHRTGQILKPEYEYVNSAIPAEQRLMMMLQKKLKSLDANTSSNQKQSNDILDVPDFLNKYGDRVVLEYLKENKDINELLGDPLKLNGASSKEIKDGAAHKASGRVAVLSTKMQEEFYYEIKDRYDSLIEYLKQTGEYDLEVEELALEAKTLSSSILKVGKGGNTSFGEDSILEKCEVNNLRKPFSTSELENMIQQSLSGKSPNEVKEQLIEDYELISTTLLHLATNKIIDKYDTLINNVHLDKVASRALEKGSIDLEARKRELEAAKEKSILDEQTKAKNKSTFILGLFKFFEVGKAYNYPIPSFDGAASKQLAVFVGFQI